MADEKEIKKEIKKEIRNPILRLDETNYKDIQEMLGGYDMGDEVEIKAVGKIVRVNMELPKKEGKNMPTSLPYNCIELEISKIDINSEHKQEADKVGISLRKYKEIHKQRKKEENE